MLSAAQLDAFETQGYLIVEDVLDLDIRRRIRTEYEELIDVVAQRRGHIDAAWQGLDFEQRLIRLLSSDPDAYEYLDISLPMLPSMSEDAGVHTGPAVFELLTYPAILDIVESIIGPEILSNPVQHVRIKPPESMLNSVGQSNSNMARTGWHQDAAVIVEEADASPILTVWVAITDANPEMGCMQAIPGSHRWDELSKHCPGRRGLAEIYIPPDLISQHTPVDLAVKAGGIVLLHRGTWHGAGPNLSERIRWSFDLRYQPPAYPTGRACFPHFLARSVADPAAVQRSARDWAGQWLSARQAIASGQCEAVFNARWEAFRSDPLCA